MENVYRWKYRSRKKQSKNIFPFTGAQRASFYLIERARAIRTSIHQICVLVVSRLTRRKYDRKKSKRMKMCKHNCSTIKNSANRMQTIILMDGRQFGIFFSSFLLLLLLSAILWTHSTAGFILNFQSINNYLMPEMFCRIADRFDDDADVRYVRTPEPWTFHGYNVRGRVNFGRAKWLPAPNRNQ